MVWTQIVLGLVKALSFSVWARGSLKPGLRLSNRKAWPGLAELEPENFLMGWTLALHDSGGLAMSCVKLRPGYGMALMCLSLAQLG